MKHMEKKVRIDGAEYIVSSDDMYLENIGDDFEPHMITIFKKLITDEDVIADVGANIGLTSILFSRLGSKVISFEPSPSTYSILCDNIRGNNLSNVTPVNIGLGNEEGVTTLTFSANNRSGGFITDICRPETGHITENIKIMRLDDIWYKFADRLNFIKIDVEGFESEVIKGAFNLLVQYKPLVVLELNHFCLNVFRRITIPEFFDFLRSIFPALYAVDVDNASIKDLHVNDESYYVMHEHLVRFRYPTIVAGFDNDRIKRKLLHLQVNKVSLLNGFYDFESWSNLPTRWMQSDAMLKVFSPDKCTANLNLRAMSFYRPRTLEIYVGDELTGRMAVPSTGFIDVTVHVRLAKGENNVHLHVPEGCERPCDIKELNNSDSRCLSIAVQNATVT